MTTPSQCQIVKEQLASPRSHSTTSPDGMERVLTIAAHKASRHCGTANAVRPAAELLVEMIGIEPTTSALQKRRSPN